MIGSSDAYNSVQLMVTLQYDGGHPITSITVEFRTAGTTNILTEYTTTYLIPQANTTSWDFSVTDLEYEESGYEVIATPSNSIGQGDGTTSQPVTLFTGTAVTYYPPPPSKSSGLNNDCLDNIHAQISPKYGKLIKSSSLRVSDPADFFHLRGL